MRNLEQKTLAAAVVALLATTILMAVPQRDAAPQQVNEQQGRLAEQIRKQIVTLSDYGLFDHITYAFEDGGATVVLRGQAAKPGLKSSAERVVAKLEGVGKVVNEIEVLPNSPNDERVRAGVYVRVYGHPTLSRYNPNRGTPLFSSIARRNFGISTDPPPGNHPIHIIVKNGDVILEGAVDTEGDKTIAGLQANSTPGSFSVTNNLVVRNAGR